MTKKEPHNTILVGGDGELLACHARFRHPERVQGIFCPYGVLLPEGLRRLGDVSDAAPFLSANSHVRRAFCSVSGLSLDDVRAVQEVCKVRAVRFCAVMPMLNDLDAEVVTARVDGSLVITPRREPLTRLSSRMLKRAFDLLLVLLFMLTLFPFIYLVKAVLIKRRERGSSFVTRLCLGPNGRQFRRVCFKGEVRSLASVFNVLKGDMSLVGPAYSDLSENEAPDTLPQRLERRHVKPGMTGWWRVKKAEPGSREQYEADVWYVEHWSLWLDVRILLRSMFV